MRHEEEWCFFHGYEPIPRRCYRLCIECGHAYTWWGLWKAEWKMNEDLGLFRLPHPRRLTFCPLCGHDFP
ncbi:MAG: hypothetical protein J2P57_16925 [Acidimicrobiaceae bacterium]|nr:hypothetical protein [Acidimicrobiaceae bacterium]